MEISQLIAACKKQNRNAQKELYEQFAPKMMGVCLRYSNSRENAEDLLHDGFIQVFTHISSYQGKGSFEGWLRRIFVNLALQNFREEKKSKLINSDVSDLNIEIVDHVDESIEDIMGISNSDILKMINELPQGYKIVFNLYVFEDMSHREIGQMLGITEASSRSQYSRAKSFLKKKIQTIL
ncbi:MAG: RNA polymerase sigma factor [Dysgonamonadaceae bacterium]|jgi:RNA polymerase sigma-70 factor (ECF subfamily)|nr:RNA polymerase sigma factor [Dysgonamonadaceae bacterium]MDD3309645.1 RNA polymerase sigma factor [Dysgonamonadaceae bacterium]MDD3901384.1 RNA polymerase sigma factor [Dysgonamonadaceae bacterium]MDD4399692.1 RNA polymerase sigma factor [Dysgonamonadaceae bacterium]MEA5082331.1 RNA polymerase sigma factor [Dysgonamonadaceae bacterium]